MRAARPDPAPAAQRAAVVREFKRAWQAMDLDALLTVLDPDAVAIADGGGKVAAALEPRVGAAAIAEFVLRVAGQVPAVVLEEQTVNGQPGLVATQDGVTVTVFAFEVVADRISRIWAVRNPDKLRPWNG